MEDWGDRLEKFGNIFVYGFGDKILEGFIPEYLSKIPIDDCLDYVDNNKDLLANVREKHWITLRKMAKNTKIKISTDEIIKHLQKNRPDLLSVIINHPEGMNWLNTQVANCREKLGI